MQSLDTSQLKQALSLTLSPNQLNIQQGEQYLESIKHQPNYAISLLMITDDIQNDLLLRQSALVNMKTFLEKCWRFRADQPFTLPEEEKQTIRQNFLDALVRCVQEKKLRTQYEDLMYKLTAIDFPQHWPDLVTTLVMRLQGLKSYEETWACLLCLRRVTENYQFLLDEDRVPLEAITQSAFPILEQLMQKFLESYNPQTGVLIKVILKIFHHCMHLQLPKILLDANVMQRWLGFMKIILDSPVAPELSSATIDEQEMLRREKSYVWMNKKWSGRIMQRIIQKFCNPKLMDPEQKEYAIHLQTTYGPPFMQSFYQILNTSNQQFQAPRTQLFALKFLYYAMRLSITGKLMAPHVEKIIFEISLPAMQLTTRDDRIWKEDPEEYIRRSEDFSVASYNIKNAASDLLTQACQQKDANSNLYLIHFLHYAQQSLVSNVDVRTQQPLSILQREAILWGVEVLTPQICKIDSLGDQIEQLLEKHIIPELSSSIGFLRARACSVFNQYGGTQFKNRQTVVRAVEGIYNCILDKELPVRVAASVAFSSILQHKEAQDLIKPGLSQVLEIYIKLMDIIDDEGIVNSLETIVKQFSQEIGPFSVQLIQHLATIFTKYCSKQNQINDNSDDDGETELAAAGCLEAIKNILNAPLDDDAYIQVEPALFPVFNFCLMETGCDFIGEILDLINLMLYKRKGPISQGMWFYYPALAYIVIGLPEQVNVRAVNGLSEEQISILEESKKDWGSEFLRQMLGSFRNFIQKGGDTILCTNDMFGNNLTSLIFKMIEKIYTINQNGNDETDLNQVTTLLITLLENFSGKIDGTVPQIVDLCLSNLQRPKASNRFKVVSLGIISLAIHYNPLLTLSYLNSKQATDGVFQMIFSLQKAWKYQWDLHRLFLGVCACYVLPMEQIPHYLLQNAQQITKTLVEFTTQVLHAREEEESCEDEEQAIEDDDDDTAFKSTVDKLSKVQNDKAENEDDDDDDDDDDFDEDDDYANLYESPLEAIDEIILFEQLLVTLQQQNPQLYMQMVGSLSPVEQETLSKNVVEAKIQYADWLKSKSEQKQ